MFDSTRSSSYSIFLITFLAQLVSKKSVLHEKESKEADHDGDRSWTPSTLGVSQNKDDLFSSSVCARSERGVGDHRRTWTFQTQTVAFGEGRHQIPRSPPLCLSAVFICIIPATPGLITPLWFACLLLKFRPGIHTVKTNLQGSLEGGKNVEYSYNQSPTCKSTPPILPSSSCTCRTQEGLGERSPRLLSSSWLKPSLDAEGSSSLQQCPPVGRRQQNQIFAFCRSARDKRLKLPVNQ